MEFRFTVHNNIGTRIVNVHPFKCESVNDFAETFDRLEAKIVDVSNVILMIHLLMFCQTIAKGRLPKKKIAQKGTFAHLGGRGVKKSQLNTISEMGQMGLRHLFDSESETNMCSRVDKIPST